MKFSIKTVLPLIVLSFFLSLLFLIAGQEPFAFAEDEEYCVNWHDAEGEIIYSENLAKNSIPEYDSSIPLPKKEGQEGKFYFFTNWSPAIEPVTQNVDYYPQYREEDHEFEITLYYGYDYDNSGIVNDEGDIYSVMPLNRYDFIEPPSLDYFYEVGTIRYTFYTWDGDIWGSQAQEIELRYNTNYIEVHALYDSTPAEYFITWVNGDGRILFVDIVLKGEIPVYNKPFLPYKMQNNYFTYNFIGWDKTPYPVDKDETYYAQFEEIDRLYKVRWIDGNANIIYSEELKYDTPLNYNYDLYGIPQKERRDNLHYYKFAGWKNYSEGDIVTGDIDIISTFDNYNEIVEEYDVQQAFSEPQQSSEVVNIKIEMDRLDSAKPLEINTFYKLSLSSQAVALLKEKGKKLNLTLTFSEKEYRKYQLKISKTFVIKGDIDGQPLEKFEGEVMLIYQTREASRDKTIWKIEGRKANSTASDCWVDESYRFEISSCGEYVLGERDYTLVITLCTVLPFLAVSITLAIIFGLKQKKKLQDG